MKKYIKWTILITCGVFIAMGLQWGKKTNLVNVSMQNIEALATSESGSTQCFGSGSVDCPTSGNKARIIHE